MFARRGAFWGTNKPPTDADFRNVRPRLVRGALSDDGDHVTREEPRPGLARDFHDGLVVYVCRVECDGGASE